MKYNEDQLKLGEISRRMTSLLSSMESLQRSLTKPELMSAPSVELRSLVAATLAYLSLTTAAQHVWQFEADRLHWIRGSTSLLSLRQHWLTACENLESWAESNDNLAWDCGCDDDVT